MKKIFTYFPIAALTLTALLVSCSSDEPAESRSEQDAQDNMVQLYKNCFVEANMDFDMEYFVETLVKQGTWLEKTYASHSGKYWNDNHSIYYDPDVLLDGCKAQSCYTFFDDGTFRLIHFLYEAEKTGTVTYQQGKYEADPMNGTITFTLLHKGEDDGLQLRITPVAIAPNLIVWDLAQPYETLIDGKKVDNYDIRSSFEPYTLLCELHAEDD